MRIYANKTVYEATVQRLHWIYDEFPNVVVSVSGGKDSTIIFEMTLEVARERGRLPLSVMWIDQEAEWQSTVDQNRSTMYHPDVKPYWMQIPVRLFNATSGNDHWLNCWKPEDEATWIHPQDPISIKENRYGTDRFSHLFDKIIGVEFAAHKTANIGGVRAEESPARLAGLTYWAKYKWATWGKTLDRKRGHYTFYPIYDWSYTDVWKAIHENGWQYNELYDTMYRYGIPIHDMRVSNVHHEQAVGALFFLQEFEPHTYSRLCGRLAGIDMAGKLGRDDYFVKDLPFMFKDWVEYRDYLLEHLIDREDWRGKLRKEFDDDDKRMGAVVGDVMYRSHIKSILTHDWEGVKVQRFRNRMAMAGKRPAMSDRQSGKVPA